MWIEEAYEINKEDDFNILMNPYVSGSRRAFLNKLRLRLTRGMKRFGLKAVLRCSPDPRYTGL